MPLWAIMVCIKCFLDNDWVLNTSKANKVLESIMFSEITEELCSADTLENFSPISDNSKGLLDVKFRTWWLTVFGSSGIRYYISEIFVQWPVRIDSFPNFVIILCSFQAVEEVSGKSHCKDIKISLKTVITRKLRYASESVLEVMYTSWTKIEDFNG